MWDTFKAFIRGILISFKADINKHWKLSRDMLLKGIIRLEEQNKQQVTREKTENLKQAYDKLKILDAHVIAKDLLYAKQIAFKFRDKPGKQLA